MKIDNVNRNYTDKTTFIHRYTINTLNKEYLKLNGCSFQDDYLNIINDRSNVLGEGRDKVVYELKNITDYVMAVLKNKFCQEEKFAEITSVKDLFPKFNFGQCIGDNYNGVQIFRRINGEPHLLPNWFHRANSFAKNGDITTADALLVLENLKQLEKFPQESFDLLVQKINYLNRKNVRLDTINPNNILIEKKAKEINPIDIEFGFHTQNIKPPYNGYNDIAYLLLDVQLHKVYLEKLPPYKRTEFIEVSKNIIKKLKLSADELELSPSLSTSRQVYREIDTSLRQNGKCDNTMELFEEFNKCYFSKLV